ncbi:MAG: hypothetical protein LBH60_07035 [Prevotellaceae bacterium]|jgi:DNA polymerase-3 subunit epsilon|nr:hypothetical protein [Prevotellaceae bacterium]
MTDFAAIDFETANYNRSGICSVEIVAVENGRITDKVYYLIRPRSHFYCSWATDIHDISYYDTVNEPEFSGIWKTIKPKLKNLPFAAHNSPFDAGCLKAASEIILPCRPLPGNSSPDSASTPKKRKHA